MRPGAADPLAEQPATIAASSGASTIGEQRFWSTRSALHRVEVFDVDAAPLAEQHDQDREADRRLGRRDGQDEEHEHLPGEVAQLARERDEVEVDREQHQLDAHQQQDARSCG